MVVGFIKDLSANLVCIMLSPGVSYVL